MAEPAERNKSGRREKQWNQLTRNNIKYSKKGLEADRNSC